MKKTIYSKPFTEIIQVEYEKIICVSQTAVDNTTTDGWKYTDNNSWWKNADDINPDLYNTGGDDVAADANTSSLWD